MSHLLTTEPADAATVPRAPNLQIGPPLELGLPYWFHLFFPDRALTTNLAILVIGCDDDIALRLARANPRARVLAVETRDAELAETEQAKRQQSLNNLELLPDWPEDAALEQGFDLIYYNQPCWPQEPAAAVLARAARLLRLEGSLHITVRAKYAWSGVGIIRELLHKLGVQPDLDGYPRAREIVAALGPDHPWNLLGHAPEMQSDDLLADWLRADEPCFSVPDIYELLAAGGLTLQRFTYQPYYLPQCSPMLRTPVLGQVRNLPPPRQHALMELYWPGIRYHLAVACRADRPAESYRIDFAGADWLLYAPLLPANLPIEDDASSIGAKARLCWRAAGMPEVRASLGSFQNRLLRALDRAEELGDLVGMAGLSGDPHLRDEWARDFFQMMWDYDFLHFRMSHSARQATEPENEAFEAATPSAWTGVSEAPERPEPTQAAGDGENVELTAADLAELCEAQLAESSAHGQLGLLEAALEEQEPHLASFPDATTPAAAPPDTASQGEALVEATKQLTEEPPLLENEASLDDSALADTAPLGDTAALEDTDRLEDAAPLVDIAMDEARLFEDSAFDDGALEDGAIVGRAVDDGAMDAGTTDDGAMENAAAEEPEAVSEASEEALELVEPQAEPTETGVVESAASQGESSPAQAGEDLEQPAIVAEQRESAEQVQSGPPEPQLQPDEALASPPQHAAGEPTAEQPSQDVVDPPARVPFRECPLCSETAFEPLREVETELLIDQRPLRITMPWMRCRRCSHVFTSGYFAGESWSRILQHQLRWRESLRGAVARRAEASRVVAAITTLRESAAGRWLDVGCSESGIAAVASEFGYDGIGVDSCTASAERLTALGYSITASSLFDVTQGPFDIISLGSGVERMPFPSQALARVRDLLAPSGLIYVSGLSSDSLRWRMLDAAGANPWWRRVDRYHVFQRRSLFRLLQNSGFEPCSYGASGSSGTGMEVVACKR